MKLGNFYSKLHNFSTSQLLKIMKLISPNIPFAPAKIRPFYGWIIVFVGVIGIVMSMPGQTVGVSAFTEHLLKAFNITRNQFSIAYMIGTILSSFFLTKAGKLYDKFGVRPIAITAAFGMGITLIILSRADFLARQFSCKPNWLAPISILVLGFFSIRFFGQGVLTMVSRNMIAKWFVRKRGVVVGISGILVSFSFSTTPVFLNNIIQKIGWRDTWVMFGMIAAFGFTVVAFLFFRDNPEDCGLLPDGDKSLEKEALHIHNVSKQFTLEEVKKNYSFWIFSLALSMCALYITGLTFHIASVFENAGMTKKIAFSIFIPASVISIFGRAIGGWISDKIKIKFLLAAFIVGLIISAVSIVFLDNETLVNLVFWKLRVAVLALIIGNGILSGLFALLLIMVWPTYFGRKNLGAISGFNMSMIVFFSAIGPWIFSQSLEAFGSYKAAGILCATLSAALLVLSFKADNPQKLVISNQ